MRVARASTRAVRVSYPIFSARRTRAKYRAQRATDEARQRLCVRSHGGHTLRNHRSKTAWPRNNTRGPVPPLSQRVRAESACPRGCLARLRVAVVHSPLLHSVSLSRSHALTHFFSPSRSAAPRALTRSLSFLSFARSRSLRTRSRPPARSRTDHMNCTCRPVAAIIGSVVGALPDAGVSAP